MIREDDQTRLNRCNTIYKVCTFVSKNDDTTVPPAHLCSEAGWVFTPTHIVELLERWQLVGLLYDFGAYVSEGLVTAAVESHVTNASLSLTTKNRLLSQITPTLLFSVYITRSVFCLHMPSICIQFGWHFCKYSVFLVPCPLSSQEICYPYPYWPQ